MDPDADLPGGPSLGDRRQSSTLDNINPQDIQSIEIIKGPAAATLYGTEASAGVVQIITKRGASGTPQFSMSVRGGVNYLKDPAGRLGGFWACTDSFTGACLGIAVAYAVFDGNTVNTLGGSRWDSQLVYSLRVTPALVLLAAALACGIGILGGLLPAIRSIRALVADSLRMR